MSTHPRPSRLLPLVLACAVLPRVASAAHDEGGPSPPSLRDPSGELDGVRTGDSTTACTGQPVASLAFEGCEGVERCDGAVWGPAFFAHRFLSITGLAPDQPLSPNPRSSRREERAEARLEGPFPARDAEAFQRAVERLRSTGFFRRVRLRCRPAQAGVAVTVVATPHTFVREVEIVGNQLFRKSELRKRVFLRSGRALDVEPGEEEAHQDVQRQIKSIESFYRREGLQDVTVEVRAKRVRPSVVDLTVRVDEGRRDRIGELVLEHEPQLEVPPGEPSCPEVDRSRLKRLVDVGVGDVVTTRTLDDIEQTLRSWFQSIGYERPEIVTRTSGEPLRLTVRVRTRYCYLIRLWEREAASVSGNRDKPAFRFRDPINRGETDHDDATYQRIALEDWREELPFGESGVFDRAEARRGVEAIRKRLHERGFLFADVSMEHQDFRGQRGGAASTEGPVAGVIDYRITHNYERRIKEIVFDGRESFRRSELLEQIGTNAYDAFAQGGFVQIDQVLSDLENLRKFYVARGFTQFRYAHRGSPDDRTPHRARSRDRQHLVWTYTFRDRGFVVRKHLGSMAIHLHIPFEEGPRTTLSRVRIVHEASADEGRALTTRRARKLLALASGDPFGTHYLEQGLEALQRWYAERGFHQASLTAECAPADDPSAWGRCDELEATEVALRVRVEEGRQSVVGEILWRGNFETSPRALVRDLPKPGDPYNEARVDDAIRRLRNLGVFNAVRVTRVGIDERPPRERIALVVSVEEGQTRFIDLGAGFRTIDRPGEREENAPSIVGSVIGQSVAASDRYTTGLGRPLDLTLPDVLIELEGEYIDRHFLGRGYELRMPLTYGFSTRDSLRLLAFNPSLEIPRFFGSDVNLELQLQAELDRVDEPLDQVEFTGAANFSWALRRRMSMRVGAEAGVVCFARCFDRIHVLPERIEEGPGGDESFDFNPQVRPLVHWRWDTQDNPLNPTEGFVLSGDFGYILDLDQERRTGGGLVVKNFLRWEGRAEAAFQTRIGPVLAAMVHYGGSVSVGSDAGRNELLPRNNRFTLGGSSGLRGFADHGVGRYDDGGRLSSEITDVRRDAGGNVVLNGSVELRVPILRESGIWTAGFVDGGALAKSHTALKAESFRASAGVGLRYLIGNQIPLRLDWGWVLGGQRCMEWASEARDNCARRESGSQIHFNMLYPF